MLSFSTFPDGKSGVGLLLLRASVGITAIIQGGVYLAKPGHSILGMWIVGLLAVASGALLLIGFLTKAASMLAGLSSVGLSWMPMSPLNSFDTKLSLFFVIIMSVAIILLGPGEFSLDSRLFGRREIIIPHHTRAPKS
jgi:uncharacterized membrane protein YphA (DoxX/SURF4 family)